MVILGIIYFLFFGPISALFRNAKNDPTPWQLATSILLRKDESSLLILEAHGYISLYSDICPQLNFGLSSNKILARALFSSFWNVLGLLLFIPSFRIIRRVISLFFKIVLALSILVNIGFYSGVSMLPGLIASYWVFRYFSYITIYFLVDLPCPLDKCGSDSSPSVKWFPFPSGLPSELY